MTDAPTVADLGHYMMRLHRKGPWVPCSVYLNRLGTLCCELGGEIVAPDRIWPWCAKHRITKEEYDYRLALLKNGERAGEIDRKRAVDPMKLRVMF